MFFIAAVCGHTLKFTTTDDTEQKKTKARNAVQRFSFTRYIWPLPLEHYIIVVFFLLCTSAENFCEQITGRNNFQIVYCYFGRNN